MDSRYNLETHRKQVPDGGKKIIKNLKSTIRAKKYHKCKKSQKMQINPTKT